MSLSQLRALVRRFVDGEIAYEAFRAEFVPQHLSVHYEDSEIERDINAIESACASFDEGDISEQDVKSELSMIISSPIITVDFAASKPIQSGSSEAVLLKSANLQVI